MYTRSHKLEKSISPPALSSLSTFVAMGWAPLVYGTCWSCRAAALILMSWWLAWGDPAGGPSTDPYVAYAEARSLLRRLGRASMM